MVASDRDATDPHVGSVSEGAITIGSSHDPELAAVRGGYGKLRDLAARRDASDLVRERFSELEGAAWTAGDAKRLGLAQLADDELAHRPRGRSTGRLRHLRRWSRPTTASEHDEEEFDSEAELIRGEAEGAAREDLQHRCLACFSICVLNKTPLTALVRQYFVYRRWRSSGDICPV